MCCFFNLIEHHSLIGSSIIRRYDFLGVGVTLLKEVCHCGVKLSTLFCSSFPQCDSQSTSYCLQDMELSAASTTPACKLPCPCHNDNKLNL